MNEPSPESAAQADTLRAGAEAVVRALRAAGHEAYFVGGCVRDLAMGASPSDYDVATDARPERIQETFPGTIAIGAAFGVIQVPSGGHRYEVATFRSDGDYPDGRHPASVTFSGPAEDAARRDFTINGLFFDPEAGRVIDFVGGREDIAAQQIRAIGDPAARFAEDHLRMVRAVRFAARLDFAIEPATWAALAALAPKITAVSAERVRDELVKMLTTRGAGRALRLLREAGLLREILPEVEAMVGIAQPPDFHPEGDVFVHTCLALDQLAAPTATLAMGALLHDLGKPPTADLVDGRWRFNRHAEVGAEMAARVCRRLRFSTAATEQIAELVASHMRFQHVTEMRPARLKRFLAVDHFDEHLALHRADCLASHGKLDNYTFCRQKMAEIPPEEIRPPRLITGHDLIALGLRPGPEFRRILDGVADAQLEGTIATRDEALALAAKLAKS